MAFFTFQKIQFSFIIDWFFIILVAVATIPFNIITPFERQFRLDDDTISHPYKDETFSIPFLVVCICINILYNYIINNINNILN